jgi:hypothetical protein
MANGVTEPSQRRWKGTIELGDIRMNSPFEVFNSHGGWEFLLGKPLLRRFGAIHDYYADMVTVRDPVTKATTVLRNQFHAPMPWADVTNERNTTYTMDVKQAGNVIGGSSAVKPPSRQVTTNIHNVLGTPDNAHGDTEANMRDREIADTTRATTETTEDRNNDTKHATESSARGHI